MVDRKQLLVTFRERLDSVIHGSGLNRSQFAEQTELDRSTLSQLLSTSNRRLPRVETLTTIAATQQVSVDWLLGLSNAGPMQAEMLHDQTSFERSTLAHNDQLLIAWLSEAIGYKIRYIPSTLPDLLKTEEVIHHENMDFATSTPEQQVETSAARLAWTRGPETDLECCNSVQSVEGFARGEGIWRSLDATVRIAQLDHMIELTDELYPTLRWFLFDGRQRYAAPITIYGPLRAAIYLGQMYLVLTSNAHVRTLTQHFDDLIRGAVVQPHEIPAFLKEQRAITAKLR
ncbi:MAG: helix-turn-helix domain-containing protein [Acidimicrobiia bacterium]